MTKGSILDFLAYAAEHPDLVHDLVDLIEVRVGQFVRSDREVMFGREVDLAAKHDFAIAPDELTDADLDEVAGGVVTSSSDPGSLSGTTSVPDGGATLGEDAQMLQLHMQDQTQKLQQALATLSATIKSYNDTLSAIVRKTG